MPGPGSSMGKGAEVGTLGRSFAWERPAKPGLVMHLVTAVDSDLGRSGLSPLGA